MSFPGKKEFEEDTLEGKGTGSLTLSTGLGENINLNLMADLSEDEEVRISFVGLSRSVNTRS